ATLAALQLAHAPPATRMHMVMGDSAKACPWCIVTFALPPLVGLIWAVRGLAPTRLRLTGIVVGFAAGGAGASAYALHCPEMTAPFMVIWYTLGIVGAALLGGLLGPRLLRW
ncbi:MAG: NrsF family protein, partial [Caulobacteraceae bacterium]